MNRSGDYTGTGYQANVARSRAGGNGVIHNVGGRTFQGGSVEANKFFADQQAQRTQAANTWVAKQNAAEMAELDQQEVEDRISENKARNSGMTALAFNNAQAGGQMGRGLFQRRQAGTKIGAALGSLANANAGSLKAARMKTLQAKQAGDLTRTNPMLGYRAAIQGLRQQLS